MRFYKQLVLFYIGGAAYLFLEFLWRGYSHGSMFLLGGACFLLIGWLGKALPHVPLALRLILCAGLITVLELLTGLLINRDYSVWDYRGLPYQFQGQICLIFSLLWVPVSLMAMHLYDAAVCYLLPKVGKTPS